MTTCPECQAKLTGDLPFCGQCGAEVSQEDTDAIDAPTIPKEEIAKQWSPAVTRVADAPSPDAVPQPEVVDAKSDEAPAKPAKKRTTGGHQPAIKQLDPATVLN